MHFATTLTLVLAPLCQPLSGTGNPQAEEKGPAPERVEATLADLDAALKGGEAEVLQRALERAQEVPHRDVVKRVQQALKDPRREVKDSAISSLRYLDHPDALAALHKLAKNRRVMRDPEYAGDVLRAIGQHGHPSSIRILAADPTQTPYHAATRARILGLGNIRTTESVDALIDLMGTSTRRRLGDERRYAAFAQDFRLSLIVLTGKDHGDSPELWEQWWRKSKKDFVISAEETPLPKTLRPRWDAYWGRRAYYEREKRREERGS